MVELILLIIHKDNKEPKDKSMTLCNFYMLGTGVIIHLLFPATAGEHLLQSVYRQPKGNAFWTVCSHQWQGVLWWGSL